MFERFNPEARDTVIQAQEEARQLGHNYIGTEHLLLALLASTTDTVARQTLNGLGVDHERVRDQILEIIGRGEGAQPGHIPFTPRSKKVLELSLREALRLRHKLIAAEHILLGLIREGEGVAAQILAGQGVDFDRLRQEIVDAIGGEPRGRGRFGRGRSMRVPVPRFSSMTRGGARVADRAGSLAQGTPVGSQHYLLGILAEEESLAAKALGALGVTREAVEAKLAEVGAEGTSDEPPEAAGARATSLSVSGDTVEVRIQDLALAEHLTGALALQQTNVLQGTSLPGSERIWKALQPVLRDVVRDLETATSEWSPPDWPASVSVAAYAVSSQPSGPVGRLLVADGVDEAAVRAWVADSLSDRGPWHDSPAAFVTVVVGRMGDVVPNAADPDAWIVTQFGSGAGPAPPHWPRRPVSELVAFSVDYLRSPY